MKKDPSETNYEPFDEFEPNKDENSTGADNPIVMLMCYIFGILTGAGIILPPNNQVDKENKELRTSKTSLETSKKDELREKMDINNYTH
jgi:hypothetical protein